MAQHQDPERRVAAQLAWLRMYPKAGNELIGAVVCLWPCMIPYSFPNGWLCVKMIVCENDV